MEHFEFYCLVIVRKNTIELKQGLSAVAIQFLSFYNLFWDIHNINVLWIRQL